MSAWKPLLVTFDFGSTVGLLPESPSGVYLQRALEQLGIEPAGWNAEALDVLARRLFDEVDHARISLDVRAAQRYYHEWAAAVLRSIGCKAGAEMAARLAEGYHANRLGGYRADPEAASTLAALRARGYRLAAVSNNDGLLRDKLLHCKMLDYFEFTVDSAEVGVAKPDPAIYSIACDRAKLKPEQCLHVGDRWDNDVAAAMAAGLKAAWLRRDASQSVPGGAEVWAVLRRLGELPARLP